MKVHNRPEYAHQLTERQWAEIRRVLNQNAKGERMYTNGTHHTACLYFDKSETHKATSEEIENYWNPIKEKRNAQNRESRKKRKELEKQEKIERENEIRKLNNELYQLRCQFESVSQTYEKIIANYIKKDFCPQGISSAETIVIDTETTGLVAGSDEVLQVSIIDDLGNTLYNQLIKPIKATEWSDAERVNHISPEMVKDCPNIYEEMSKINAILRNAKTLIGYNTSGFDIRFLECFGADFSKIEKFVDVMFDFAEIYGEWSDYYESYKWQKLTTCADYYGYDWKTDKAHDSLADCRATLFCYKAMCNETKHEENDQ